MAFRIVSIEHSSELHVANGQLRVVREDAECTIPLSDIIMVVCMGANIRISTMALGLLAESYYGFDTWSQPYAAVHGRPHGLERPSSQSDRCTSGHDA